MPVTQFESPTLISGPRVLPFRQHHVCPSCGHDMLPFHRLLQRFFGGADRHMRQVLCWGGKEPTEEGAVVTVMGPVKIEQQHTCAGIHRPHLHVSCGNCGFAMLTETRSQVQR